MSTARVLRTMLATEALDVSTLDPAVSDQIATMLLAASDADFADNFDNLNRSPNFCRSTLFDKVVGRASVEDRRAVWVRAGMTAEQAARHFKTETDRSVRQAIALRHKLPGDGVQAARLTTDDLADPATVIWLARACAWGEPSHLPTDICVEYVLAFSHQPQTLRLASNATSANGEVALALVDDRRTPAWLRWEALSHPEVPAVKVVETLNRCRPAGPDDDFDVDPFEEFVRYRPRMTAAELEAARAVAALYGVAASLEEVFSKRDGWELSEGEFVDLAVSAPDTEALEALVDLVPAGRWGDENCPLWRAVVMNEHATPPLVERLTALARCLPSKVVARWSPTERVWESPSLLGLVVKLHSRLPVVDLDGFDEHRDGWSDVLSGPGAEAFTRRVLDDPGSLKRYMWQLDIAWAGDLTDLAMVVPAGVAMHVGSSRLLAAIVNVIGSADDGSGTLWPMFTLESPDKRTDVTVADLVAAHAAATS